MTQLFIFSLAALALAIRNYSPEENNVEKRREKKIDSACVCVMLEYHVMRY